MVEIKEKARRETRAFFYPYYTQELEKSQERWYSLEELMPAAVARILLKSLNPSNE